MADPNWSLSPIHDSTVCDKIFTNCYAISPLRWVLSVELWYLNWPPCVVSGTQPLSRAPSRTRTITIFSGLGLTSWLQTSIGPYKQEMSQLSVQMLYLQLGETWLCTIALVSIFIVAGLRAIKGKSRKRAKFKVGGSCRTLIIRNLAYFDSHTVLIKVCNTAHNIDCRRKKPPKFVPLKLEICLNYAYSLDLCCYNIVWTLTCFNGVCMCG